MNKHKICKRCGKSVPGVGVHTCLLRTTDLIKTEAELVGVETRLLAEDLSSGAARDILSLAASLREAWKERGEALARVAKIQLEKTNLIHGNEPQVYPDGEHHDRCLDYLRACASSWMGDARILGNLRAKDTVRAIDEVRKERDEARADCERLRASRDYWLSKTEEERSISQDLREYLGDCVKAWGESDGALRDTLNRAREALEGGG